MTRLLRVLSCWPVGVLFAAVGAVHLTPSLAIAQPRDPSELREMLIWTGHLSIADHFEQDGGIRKALKAFRNGAEGPVGPNDTEWQKLKRVGEAERAKAGFVIREDGTGACIGIPERAVSERRARDRGAFWTTNPKWIEIDALKLDETTLSALKSKLKGFSGGGARRMVVNDAPPSDSDWFAIAGYDTYPRGIKEYFYVRAHIAPASKEIQGVSVTWNGRQQGDVLASAVAYAFWPFPKACPPQPPQVVVFPPPPPPPPLLRPAPADCALRKTAVERRADHIATLDGERARLNKLGVNVQEIETNLRTLRDLQDRDVYEMKRAGCPTP